MSKIYSQKTARGQQLIALGSRWKGDNLKQCYEKPSKAKQDAFDNCYEKYLNTPNHEAFSICSFSRYGFTCSWLGSYNDQDALFIETKENSYIVLFDDVE